mgnify:CR=1 FL=1
MSLRETIDEALRGDPQIITAVEAGDLDLGAIRFGANHELQVTATGGAQGVECRRLDPPWLRLTRVSELHGDVPLVHAPRERRARRKLLAQQAPDGPRRPGRKKPAGRSGSRPRRPLWASSRGWSGPPA